MNDQAPVPVVVLSQREDDAEAINQSLRNAGHAAHCRWLAGPADLAPVVAETTPELLFFCARGNSLDGLNAVTAVRDDVLPETPVICVHANCDEAMIADALSRGAQDLVSLTNKVRLQAVALRELHHCRQTRALLTMEKSTQHLEAQLETLVKEAADAIMLVQEGIIVNVNPAWLELLNFSSADDLVGTPALDVFAESSHTALKGAMAACGNGKWSGHKLEIKAIDSDASRIDVEAALESAHYDDEPCVRISLSIDERKTEATPRQIVESSERHPLTGFFRRQRFLSEMEKKIAGPSRGGLWVLAYIKPDAIADLREQIGPLSSDDLLLEFARILQDHVRQHDIYGQFGGDLFMVLLPRGTERDAHAWAENLRSSVASHVFELPDRSLSITCSIGLARLNVETEDLAALILKAQKAYQKAVAAGGNRTLLPDGSGEEHKHQQGDTVYVKKIKAALMQDNFRLVYQPVANLGGQSQQMFDVLLRLMDNHRELMPSVFLPPARRNQLMKNIDRWVIANAIRFCAEHRPAGLFIRLSSESIPDKTLVRWVSTQLKATKIDTNSLIFQITESDCENKLRDVKNIAAAIKQAGCQVALEHFGVAKQPLQILEHVHLDYLKIDGSLMEGIATDKNRQSLVRTYIEAAAAKQIATVAERVEDANTMAVLWQLGIEFIQGFYVQGPEEIVLESA